MPFGLNSVISLVCPQSRVIQSRCPPLTRCACRRRLWLPTWVVGELPSCLWRRYVAAPDGLHVLPQRVAVVSSLQELAAALAMPTGGVQGGLNVNVSGDSEPLLQLSVAYNALYVHNTAQLHMPL